MLAAEALAVSQVREAERSRYTSAVGRVPAVLFITYLSVGCK